MAEVTAEGPSAEPEPTPTSIIDSKNGEVASSLSESPARKGWMSTLCSLLPWLLVLMVILASSGVAVIMFDVIDYKRLTGAEPPSIILAIKQAESLTGGIFEMDFDPTKVVNDAVEEFSDLKNSFLAILSNVLMDEDDLPNAVRKKGEFLPPRRVIEGDYLPAKKKVAARLERKEVDSSALKSIVIPVNATIAEEEEEEDEETDDATIAKDMSHDDEVEIKKYDADQEDNKDHKDHNDLEDHDDASDDDNDGEEDDITKAAQVTDDAVEESDEGKAAVKLPESPAAACSSEVSISDLGFEPDVPKEKVKHATLKKEPEVPKEEVKPAPAKKEPDVPKEKVKHATLKKEPEVPKEEVKPAPAKKEPDVPKEKVKHATLKKEPEVPKEEVKPAPAKKEPDVPKEKVKHATLKKEPDVPKEKPAPVKK
ncbi:hypothetical protein AAFF_G00410810, partial [Aldrovandia affinis]